MTVHNVTILAEKPDGVTIEEIREAVDEYVDRHEEVLQPERREVFLRGGAEDPTHEVEAHVKAVFRFGAHEGKRALLDRAESLLQRHVKWYVVRHHWCNHDEDGGDRGECGVDETSSHGPVPEEVAA